MMKIIGTIHTTIGEVGHMIAIGIGKIGIILVHKHIIPVVDTHLVI